LFGETRSSYRIFNEIPNISVIKGRASHQVQRIIGQEFLLKSGINFIPQFFYQTEFLSISKRQFETSETMRILNTRHVISK
jgi:hypothetical protein